MADAVVFEDLIVLLAIFHIFAHGIVISFTRVNHLRTHDGRVDRLTELGHMFGKNLHFTNRVTHVRIGFHEMVYGLFKQVSQCLCLHRFRHTTHRMDRPDQAVIKSQYVRIRGHCLQVSSENAKRATKLQQKNDIRKSSGVGYPAPP